MAGRLGLEKDHSDHGREGGMKYIPLLLPEWERGFMGKVAGAVADRVPEKTKILLYFDAFHPEKGGSGHHRLR